MSHTVHKVCPVVLRLRDGREQILAFRHPLAGTQLVKGTLEPGEQPAAAALRELAEESGIDRASATEKIGELDIPEAEQRWDFYLCSPDDDLPEQWDFFTTDGGGHVFRFFWYNLDDEPDESWHPDFRTALAYVRAWRRNHRTGGGHEPEN